MHLELDIGSGEGSKSVFKWNVSYLKGEIIAKIKERWKDMPVDAIFFYKLRNMARFYRQASKQETMVNRIMELDTLAKLEIATANIYEDINNFQKQGDVNRLKEVMENIETRKAKRVVLRSRIK